MATTGAADINRLREIKTFPSLVKYLRDELDWPIESDDFEEVFYDYAPEELGIDPENAAKIQEIKQLRPLADGQPWGIFFIKFEPRKLPVVALRRILRALVIRKRGSANKAQQKAWELHDLLFISLYGMSEHREIAFAHFAEEPDLGDLPTLRVLGWDDENTQLHLEHADHELREKLRWPDDEGKLGSWRSGWSSAFALRHGEVIRTAKAMAERLAELARKIRKRVNAVLRIESDQGPLRRLHKSFREALIHDLSEDDFADMYAQTISYGLLTARISRPAGIVGDNLRDMVPVTNPFLRDLLETFLTVGGRKGKIEFDELGVSEVVQMLRAADMEAVLRDFGDRNPQEDPAIHFYELFLKEYDPDKRVKRGVFYTPRPVVSYIVRSVHEALQTEFGLPEGLASTTTWKEMAKRYPGLEIPKGTEADSPFVQILDPAVGTGTFLVEVIDVVHKTMLAKWRKENRLEVETPKLWNEYVSKHVLPRLHGYELMMAPYAIAHMKIGLKLYETGYRFGSEERARIYLTNSLEPPQDFSDRLAFDAPALAHEAKAVNAIKREQRFTVIIGNPPYSGISSNMTEHAQQIVDAYKIVDGQALNERKLWLQDDYVKFIRLAQTTVGRAQSGVLGFITNHGYLGNPTFRGMRQSLMGDFYDIRVLNLHGNANKKEESPDGSQDENVFDIRQGVAIFLGVRGERTRRLVQHAELWGTREAKYEWLTFHSIGNSGFASLSPDSPFYFFEPQNTDGRAEYDLGWRINEVMPVNSAGFITARDHFVIDLDREQLLERIADFADPKLSNAEVRKRYFEGRGSDKYPDGDTRGWKVPQAREQIQRDKKWRERVSSCLYRPFDVRWIYWADWMVDWPRPEVMRHMLAKGALALACSRSVEIGRFEHALCTDLPIGHHTVSLKEVNYIFPLYLLPDEDGDQRALHVRTHREANFAPEFLNALADRLHMTQTKRGGIPEGLTPEDLFQYAYAIFFSPEYRRRYAEYLKSDFPRLPLTGKLDLFRGLSALGAELVALHVLESPKLDRSCAKYDGPGRPEVERISYARKTVWLDKDQTRGFQGVPEAVWNFRVGGYQVCEKWLKDRKGRKLLKDDIEHYQRIIVALAETIRVMKDIDVIIDKHGGWPGAFTTESVDSNRLAGADA